MVATILTCMAKPETLLGCFMISYDHRCIFVHLRRTGGNSVEHALGGIRLLDRDGAPTSVWDDTLHRGQTPYKINLRGHYIHDGAPRIRTLFPQEFASYFKFSVVRNPWAQCLSIFFRVKPGQAARGNRAAFHRFLGRYLADKAEGTIPDVSLFDETGACLVDRILRFETLETDFATLCQDLDLPRSTLFHHNATRRTDYRSFYDDTAAETVAAFYARDIARFGFDFGG